MIAVLLSYLPLLLMTLAAELAVVAMLAPAPRREALRACVALNLCTHPLATLCSWYVPAEASLAIELVVCGFEWVGYSRLLWLSPLSALRLALPANVASSLVGVGLWLASM